MSNFKRKISAFLLIALVFISGSIEALGSEDDEEDTVLQKYDFGMGPAKEIFFCKEVCGSNNGVICNMDYNTSENIKCSCEDSNLTFDKSDKECKAKEIVFCKEVCGMNYGVICLGEKDKKETINCCCEDNNQAFDESDKACKAKEIVFCNEVCGNNDGVICYGDKHKKEYTWCSCKDDNKAFDESDRQCKECDCGNDAECQFRYGEKRCYCYDGFVEYNGTCTDCGCGSNAKCVLIDEVKMCFCFGGFVEYYGVCTECDCGWNGRCELEDGVKKCFCEEGFAEYNGVCTGTCDDEQKSCKNGGACVKNNGNKFCSCKKGTSGHFCEIVYDCHYRKICGDDNVSGAICTFNVEKGIAECECKEISLQYDKTNRTCRDTCDVEEKFCKNGGVCDENNGNKFCLCNNGTSGHFCEIVDECNDDPNFCGDENISGASCVFNVSKGIAACECNDTSSHYDSDMGICRVDYCQRNCGEVKCMGNKFIEDEVKCICPADFEEFDDSDKTCKINYCEQKCGFVDCTGNKFIEDEVKCICPTDFEEFDYSDKTCKKINFSSTTSSLQSTTVTTILTTTAETNNLCKRKCGGTSGVECKGDFTSEETVTCVCKEEQAVYIEDKKICKKPCDISNDECKNGGQCEYEGEYEFCNCKIGTSGDRCEIIDNCANLQCNPKNSVCSYDQTTESAFCKCKNINEAYDLKTDNCFRFDGCILKMINNECNKPNEHCINNACTCKENYKYSKNKDFCEGKEICSDEKVNDECSEKSALCREVSYGKGYQCYCANGFKKDSDGTCKRKCDLKKPLCIKMNAVCELNENYEAECECPPFLTQKDGYSPCSEIAKVSYTGKLSVLKVKYVDEEENDMRLTDLIDSVKLKRDLKESCMYVYGKNFKNVKLLDYTMEEDVLECRIELQLVNEPWDMNALTSATFCYPLNRQFCLVKNLIIKREESADVFQPTNPCIVKDMFCDETTVCTSNRNTFSCTCKAGFRAIGSFNPVSSLGNLVERCADIDECRMKTAICPANSTCYNTYGSYECICNDGFKNKFGNLDSKKHGCEAVCDPNPCKNDGECVQKRNYGFVCNCKTMFTGSFCNETVPIKDPEVDHIIPWIVAAVLGTLMLFILITVVVFYKKWKRAKDDYSRYRDRGLSAEIAQLQRNQRNENEYEEIDLNTNSRYAGIHRKREAYRRICAEGKMIPRVQLPPNKNDDPYQRDRPEDTEISNEHPAVSSNEARTLGSEVYFLNRAFTENK